MEFNNFGLFSIGTGIVFFLFEQFDRNQMKTIMEEGYKTNCEVVGYENKTLHVAGSYRSLEYPIVEYIDKWGEKKIGFIKYAKSSGRYFSIGKEVPIVIHDRTIYYKHSLDNSIFRPLAIILVIIGLGYKIYKYLKQLT
jgi:hypothetical protein